MNSFICQDCNIGFDNQSNLKKHQTKFCVNSKYGNVQLLQKQFNQVSKGKDISMYGKMSLAQKGLTYDFLNLKQKPNNNIDREYQQILDQINNRNDLKQKMQREKNQAYKQLQFLQKRQNDLIIDNKEEELSQIINRKKRLQQEQQQLLQEIQEFRLKKKQFQQSIVKNTNDQDFVYKEGRHAGKLAKQRQMLQQKKIQLQRNLKVKKKQKDQIQHQLRLRQSEANQPQYIPDVQSRIKPKGILNNKQTNRSMMNSLPGLKTPEDSLDSFNYENNFNKTKSFAKVNQNNNQYPISNNNYNEYQNKISSPLQQYNSYRGPEVPNSFNMQKQPLNNELSMRMKKNKESSSSSWKTQIDQDNPYLNAKTFSQNHKLLSQMVNTKGKSQQDLFIQQLNAQEYDALNLLAKLPKTSDLYQLKLTQYKQLSKLRDQYKIAAHKKRVQKMKRQFQFQKQIMQKQKNNVLWVDQNRKVMLAEQMNIIQAQERFKAENFNSKHQSNQPYENNTNYQPQNSNPNNLSANRNPNQSQSQPYISKPFNPDVNLQSNAINTKQQYKNMNLGSQQLGSKTSINNNNNSGQSNPYRSNNYNNNQNQQPASLLNMYNQRNKQENYYHSNQPPRNSELWGYKITVLNLKNYDKQKPIRFKLILKQHNPYQRFSQDSSQWTFNTTYHYDKAPKDDPYNPTINNKADPSGNIIFNEHFIVPVNLQNLYNQNQNQIYLFVIAAQKDQTKMSNEPITYGWYSMKISHFAQIKEGRFTLSLYEDKLTYPQPSDMNKKKEKLQQQITIELNEVILDKIKPSQQPQLISQQNYKPPEIVNPNQNITKKSLTPPISNGRISKTPLSNGIISQTSLLKGKKNRNSISMKQRESYKKSSSKQVIPPKKFDKQIFFPNQLQTDFMETNSKQSKNFDLIIGSLRTLPSYVGPVKLQISFIDNDNILVIPKQEVLAQLGNDMYNPAINYIRKIRNQVSLTPSTIVFIRILAISAFDFDVYMLGFTIFYLYFQQNGSPCQDNNMKQYLITTGYYQIPIFWGSCEPHFTRIDQIIEKHPIIPCTSMLIGLIPNNTDQLSPIPQYNSKMYNTILFNVQEIQFRLFQEQYKRQILNTSQQIQGYLKYKGIGKKYSFQEAQKYIFKTMSFTKDVVQNLFPLDFMAQYNPIFGIFFVCDKIKIINDSNTLYYYFITVSICPPAKYYKNKQNDLKFTYQVDQINSKKNQILFLNNELFFTPQFNLNTALIIEIKRGKINQDGDCQKQIQSCGHCVLPVFKQIETIRSVDIKKQDLIVYQGGFNKRKIDEVEGNLQKYISNQIQIPYSNIELSYRLVNGYFPGQFNPILADKSNNKSKYTNFFKKNTSFSKVIEQVKKCIQQQYSVSL